MSDRHDIKVLGEGTYGSVIEVDISGQRYAEKTYKERNCSSAVRELSFLRKISHPNIITLDKVTIKDGTTKALLEICDSDIASYFEIQRSEELMIKIFHSILCSIEFMHSKNLVHGDLTSHNILMKRGVVKLADFGMVREAGKRDLVTTTVPWRAPEALVAELHTLSIDMWSVGVIIMDCATAKEIVPHRVCTEQKALESIFSRLGCPPDWKHRDSLSSKLQQYPVKELDIKDYAQYRKVDLLNELLRGCLQIDETKRLTATQALDLPLFAGMERPKGSWEPDFCKPIFPLPQVSDEVSKLFPNADKDKLQRLFTFTQAVEKHMALSDGVLKASFYIVSALGDDDDQMSDWLEDPYDFKNHKELSSVLKMVDFRLL
jgi:serine/threonine protein kinase